MNNRSHFDEREELERPVFNSWHIEEPLLLFGNGLKFADQKTGLTTYGPCRLPDQKSTSPSTIKIGIIGTIETISLVERLIEKASNKVSSENKEPYLRPTFPGFKQVFDCDIITSPQWQVSLTEVEVENAFKGNFENRINNIANLFSNALKLLRSFSFTKRIEYPFPETIYSLVLMTFCMLFFFLFNSSCEEKLPVPGYSGSAREWLSLQINLIFASLPH